MRALLPIVTGLAAVAAGTAFGWDARILDVLVTPPSLIRAGLIAAALLAGTVILGRAVARIAAGGMGEVDLGAMIRGVRLVFLAVAAFAAAGGWFLGHPLPLIVALVIAGVDVVETSFLLLVVSLRREP